METAANLILIQAFEKMVKQYNDKVEGINYTDLRDFEKYLTSKGINVEEIINN